MVGEFALAFFQVLGVLAAVGLAIFLFIVFVSWIGDKCHRTFGWDGETVAFSLAATIITTLLISGVASMLVDARHKAEEATKQPKKAECGA